VKLLAKCIEIDDNVDYKIRVGMMNPMYLRNMIDELLRLYIESNKIFKFIHIPVQSGSERILRKMKRGHTAKTFKQIVRKFRESIPDITIATDIITGFPGETDEDFELTLKMLIELEPDIINSSKYSPRPGTEASKLKRMDQSIITKRSEILHSIIKNITRKRNSKWINWKGSILIDEIVNGKLKGRNQYYKSVILKDNNKEIFTTLMKEDDKLKSNEIFNGNKSFHNMNLKNQNFNAYLGKTIDIKIVEYSDHTLEGVYIT
jgi:tRNA A37 methylthiotransferase MiaB